MRHFYFFSFLLLTALIGQAQIINIPDPNFKAKIIANGIDTNQDGEIQQSEASAASALYLIGGDIHSLEGIQNFSNITLFECSNNPLTEINLCGTAVFHFRCGSCPNLTSINLKNSIVSEVIYFEPPLPPFIVADLPSLQYVCCDAGEVAIAQAMFDTPGLTIDSTCDTTTCSSALHTLNTLSNFSLSVYPNPAQTTINLEFNENVHIQSISIYNLLGQRIKFATDHTRFIDTSELSSGGYIIKIIGDQGTASAKFIKE